MSNRAFRITFDPKVSKFVIEIQGWMGIYWVPSMVEEKLKDAFLERPEFKVRHFGSFDEAQEAVIGMGLDKVYDDFTRGAPWQGQSVQVVGYQPVKG